MAFLDAGIDEAELLTLTPEDLSELLPGFGNFQNRKKMKNLIYEYLEVQEQKIGPEMQSAVLNNPNKQKDLHDKWSGQEEPTRGQEITRPKTMTIKVHLMIHGNTLKMHEIFLNKLGLQTQVCGLEQCRVVLVFCPIAFRKDTDINSASRMIPGGMNLYPV
ncbi:hypothetical protein JZ751_005125 [Albula glossodonta]|uniref:SAM domain-containing protein n=1 Tax=Albula glossodonta TaxID=121402 RepID=A0A8T2PFJ9_9TELE|nr:hypothetical protein JZ751_005125 [Albula glossodonta]